MSVTKSIISQLKADRGRGRPKKPDSLTPAQKQAAYRERQRAKIGSLEVNHAVTCDRYNEQNKKIAELEIELARLKSFIGEYVDHCGIYTQCMPKESWSIRAKDMFKEKSNVTKNYKQVDIED